MRPPPAPATRTVAVLLASVVLALVSGCSFRSGTTESDAGWHTKADRTLGTAVSSVGTAELLLKAAAEGRVTHAYVVVAIRDTITVLGKDSEAFLSVQPPTGLRKEHLAAVRAVSAAEDLLDRASVAVTASDSSARRAVLRELRSEHASLSDLQSRLDKSAR